MPGKVKVKIISGKNLPVMDRSSDTTDAYVEIKLGNTTYKTDVCRRTLHPHWNTDWYRFEVDDSELQDEPLQIRLMDHDTYSANDAIGKVYLNLNPLLLPVAGQLVIGDNNPHHEISGWIPVYDTMHGIRGEVNVTVKVELFSDFNRYRQSSCGVPFFYSPTVPHGYQARVINGFVEELIVDDDPEYQWIDKIRTPRASNEARQTLFFKLSGELQRKIGVKALNLGGNAVIGYKQSFDLEGESGIVARGIGTAVSLIKVVNVHPVVVESKEEDIQNYLNFVGDGKSFSLCSASPSHKFHFPFSHFKPFPPVDETSLATRAPKLNRQHVSLDSNILGPSLSNPNLHEADKTSIKVLLNQEDKRGESAMARRFQKFKHSQKSLSKKMIALKAKLNDSIGEEADEDLPTVSYDKRKHFKRTASDSSAMAEILARSVIQATSSLSSILENQNVPKEEDTMQELEPIANLLIKTGSQTSIVDDNASDAQSCSSSESSSSGSDYEYRYYRKSSNDMDTISNIITNVEKLQRCLSREGLHKQYSMPAIPTKGFSLGSLDKIDSFEAGDFTDYKFKRELPTKPSYFDVSSIASSTSNFSSYSFRNDKTKIQEESFLEGDGNKTGEEISQLEDIELSPNNTERTASQITISDKNLTNTNSHTVDNIRNPPRQDYKGESQGEINMPHFKSSKECLRSEPKGIIKTALQTMLFERANILETPEGQSVNKNVDSQNLPPPNPFVYPDENIISEDKQKNVVKTALQTMLMDRVNMLGTPTKELDIDNVHFPTPQTANSEKDETAKGIKDNSSKLETIDQSISPSENTSFGNFKGKPLKPLLIQKGEVPEPTGIVNTALQTMLMERVNMLGTPSKEFDIDNVHFPTPQMPNSEKDETAKGIKDNNSKLETIGQSISPSENTSFGNSKGKPLKPLLIQEGESPKPTGIVNTALQTMLMERVNMLGTPTKEFNIDNVQFSTPQTANSEKDETAKGIKNNRSKLETIGQSISPSENTSFGNSKDKPLKPLLIQKGESPEPTGIVNTALQTMLFERVNILETASNRSVIDIKLPHESPKSAVVDYVTDSDEYRSTEDTGHIDVGQYIATRDDGKLPRLLPFAKTHQDVSTSPYTPDKTDEVQVITPVSAENISIEPKKMVKTAMQTMLLEKVSILGTYTPPTSPTLSGGNVDRRTRFPFCENTQLGKKTCIPKSFSSASFDEHHRKRHKETVLGMPFTSLSSLTSEYEKYVKKDRINCMSDSHLHKPMIETLKEKSIARKKLFKFLHTKTGTSSKHGGMFNKFLKHSKKNFPEDEVHKEGPKEYHQNILSRMFHVRHEEKSIKDEATQTSTGVLNQSVSFLISETNQSPNNTSKMEISSPKPPSNTDIASGDFLAQSKTNLACITSNRHHSSPASSDKQENNSGEKKPDHSPDAIKISHSPAKVNYMVPLHRRSSDSDLSVTPKGNSLTGSDRSVGNTAAYFMRNNCIKRGLLNQENFEMLEFPFLTMTRFCPKFIVQMGGSISARSVKLLDRILNPEEPESRDIWWSEIRMEIRSHARSLNCNAVLGYTESASICDDVCVLSACGTAAVVDLNYSFVDDDNILTVPKYAEKDKNVNGLHRSTHDSPDHRELAMPPCRITHLPYDEKTVHVKAKVTKCPMCLKGRVPEVLIATIEPSDSMPNVGKGCFIESHVSRPLKDLRGETIAKEISDGLPFMEYELHRLLVNKLKIRAMNAIFSLKIRITVGEKMLVGVATGTAMYMSPLPTPDLPMLVTDRVSDEKIVADLQEMLKETVKQNREIYQIKDDNQNSKQVSDEDSDEDHVSMDITCGNKDCCILEMDDPEDAEVLNLLMEEKIPDGFHVVSTESVPGLEDLEIVKNLQMFTQIYRAKLTPPYNLQTHFVRLLQSVYFKLRRMVPCALCDLQFRVDLPEPDEIQLCVIGMALGLGKKTKKPKPVVGPRKPEEDLMFKLDEDPFDSPPSLLSKSQPSSLKYRGHRSPSKYSRTQSVKQRHILNNVRHGVDITPLSYVPGGNIEQYLGNLNFFFIRETTSIREEGGLSGFIHSFITEVLAIVRSHVTALGGNALVAFFMTECVLNHNLHKNQGQCLINVGGDVVFVSYEP